MIRFNWLQFRLQAAVAACLLAIIALALALTGPHLSHLYATTIANCGARGDCSTATVSFLSHYRLLQDLGNLVIAVPVVVGMFWGAPLVARELETGTHRLVWTQSVTRTRWLAAKLGLMGLASVAASGLLSLMVTWWSSPIDRVNMNQFTSVFDQRGVVPVGYAAFAFALGVFAGLLARRTLPAMAATLVAFVTVRVAITFWVRPHLMAPVQTTSRLHMTTAMTFDQTNNGPLSVMGAKPGAWVFSDQIVGPSGGSVSGGFLSHGACLQSRASAACIGKLRDVLVYQPANRYWAFQWYEMAIFIGLATILSGLCFWWVRRRLS
jgi:ABC-type transport system involved in multi-copper enzyme maturation permease subunit